MQNEIANAEAEKSVIGCLVNDVRVQDQALRLTGEDFTVPAYRALFEVVRRLQAEDKPVDLVMVGDRVKGDEGLLNALLDASTQNTLTFNAKSYADLVLDASMRRKVSGISERLYRVMGDWQTDALDELATARAKLADIGAGATSEWLSMIDLCARTFKDIEDRCRGLVRPVQCGIADIDRLTGGFFPGELTIVGARPGVGKSVFGMMTAMNAARAGHKSGVCSLEMMDTQYGQRLFSQFSGIDGMRLRKANDLTSEDWKLLMDAMAELIRLPSAFLFASRYVEDLVLAARNKMDRGGLDILVVDYLQLMQTRQRTESQRLSVAAVSWSLKNLSIECRVPVIALAQLKRPEPGAANRMPTMHDLRETGNLEADADNIIMLHEPDHKDDPYVYEDDRDGFDAIRRRGDRYVAMKVEKQRQGTTGVVSVIFQPNRMRYLQIERQIQPPTRADRHGVDGITYSVTV